MEVTFIILIFATPLEIIGVFSFLTKSFSLMKKTQNRINSPTCLRICLYVMLVMFASCNSCKKELTTEDLVAQLPPATQTGANTFGCLIDGKPYVPNGYTGWSGTYPAMGGGM